MHIVIDDDDENKSSGTDSICSPKHKKQVLGEIGNK